MSDGQMKAGLRNALIVLLIVLIGLPMIKVGVQKDPLAKWIPDVLRNWILMA